MKSLRNRSLKMHKQVDIRLLHRKHSFSKTSREFSVGETIGTAHSDRDVAQRVPRAEGRLRSERSHQKEGYLTLSPGGGRETKGRGTC